ncbi:hypothetical protein M9H77_00276 [Catharanthus roseus]|nr:hypothetical protein M9H77_00276 [Catharanthus roseus]
MEDDAAASESKEKIISYCVTGASGYIGSWLVKSLLRRGYNVHATLRNPEKAQYLLKHWEGGERLRLFKADLQEEGSFDEAVRGCSGIYHVAASMEFDIPVKDNVDSYVQANVIEPAIRGTLNVLKACLKTNSVRRVIFTSSVSTMTAKDSLGNWRPFVDESCKTPIDLIWRNKPNGWVYVLMKLLTEEAAFQFSQENGIDLVSVITTTVAGSFFTSTVPSSIQVLLSPITGDPRLFPILVSVNSRMGSIALVHIEDICNAHIFLMEHAGAEGRYICCTQSCEMSQLVNYLIKEYPCSNLERLMSEKNYSVPSEISSNKLLYLGFTYKYNVEDIIRDTIAKCLNCRFLPQIQK